VESSCGSVKLAMRASLFLLLLLTPAKCDQEAKNQQELQQMSERQLLQCVNQEDCRRRQGDWDLANELAGRKDTTFLIQSFDNANTDQRIILIKALVQIDNPRVEVFMRRIAFSDLKPEEADGEPAYFPLQYLAKRCDKKALARLSRYANIEQAYPVGCILWQDTVDEFGTCEYRPAIPYLIEALTTACLNINDNALKGLQKFFPNACRSASSYEKAQQCYRNVAQKHGIKLYGHR